MREVQVGVHLEWGKADRLGTALVAGHVTVSRFAPRDASLWLHEVRAARDAAVEWVDDHGDEAIYVRSGRLNVAGEVCSRGEAIVLEQGCHASIVVLEDAELVHVGSSDRSIPSGVVGPPSAAGSQLHRCSAGSESVCGEDPAVHFFADSFCPTCRISFFRVSCADRFRSPSHTHSEDEIIHVLDGELRFGTIVVPAGASVFVPSGQRYGFHTPGGFEYLNYRRDASVVTLRPDAGSQLETGRDGVVPDEFAARFALNSA